MVSEATAHMVGIDVGDLHIGAVETWVKVDYPVGEEPLVSYKVSAVNIAQGKTTAAEASSPKGFSIGGSAIPASAVVDQFNAQANQMGATAAPDKETWQVDVLAPRVYKPGDTPGRAFGDFSIVSPREIAIFAPVVRVRMNNYWCCKNAGGENTGFYLGLARARDYVDASANSVDVIDTPPEATTSPAPLAPHSASSSAPAAVAGGGSGREARPARPAAAAMPAADQPVTPRTVEIRTTRPDGGRRPQAALLACGVLTGLAGRRSAGASPVPERPARRRRGPPSPAATGPLRTREEKRWRPIRISRPRPTFPRPAPGACPSRRSAPPAGGGVPGGDRPHQRAHRLGPDPPPRQPRRPDPLPRQRRSHRRRPDGRGAGPCWAGAASAAPAVTGPTAEYQARLEQMADNIDWLADTVEQIAIHLNQVAATSEPTGAPPASLRN